MANYRFGKHPPKTDYRTLRFASYVTAALPPPPPAYSVLDRVFAELGTKDPAALFPMDGNDQYGDCTCAAVAHAITAWRGLVGTKKAIMAEKAVLKLYMHLSGGVDSGLNELDVLNYWRQNAVDGDKILGFASIKPKDHDHVKQAIHLFGGCYWASRCRRTRSRSSSSASRGHPGRSRKTATRSTRWPTTRPA
jgi:hypothetical protein